MKLFLFSGTYNVLINPGKSKKKINFRLKSKASSRKFAGILCEKGNSMLKSVSTNMKNMEQMGFCQ